MSKASCFSRQSTRKLKRNAECTFGRRYPTPRIICSKQCSEECRRQEYVRNTGQTPRILMFKSDLDSSWDPLAPRELTNVEHDTEHTTVTQRVLHELLEVSGG